MTQMVVRIDGATEHVLVHLTGFAGFNKSEVVRKAIQETRC